MGGWDGNSHYYNVIQSRFKTGFDKAYQFKKIKINKPLKT